MIWIIGGLALLILIILLFGYFFLYNIINSRYNKVGESFSTISIIEKQRQDQLTMMIAVFKKYLSYENQLLTKIIELRSHTFGSNAEASKSKDEDNKGGKGTPPPILEQSPQPSTEEDAIEHDKQTLSENSEQEQRPEIATEEEAPEQGVQTTTETGEQNQIPPENMANTIQAYQKSIQSGPPSIANAIKALMEDNPEIKADAQSEEILLNIQHLEGMLQAARRNYNAAVIDYNNSVTLYPSKIVATAKGYKPMPYLEIDAAERARPDLSAILQ